MPAGCLVPLPPRRVGHRTGGSGDGSFRGMRRPLLLLTGLLLAGLVWGLVAWFGQRPPPLGPGLERITSFQHAQAGTPDVLVTSDDGSLQVTVPGVGYDSELSGDDLLLSFSVSGPAASEPQGYLVSRLQERDVVTAGPVTIEVVKLYDSWLGRNDEADLRISFASTGLDRAPVPANEVQVIHAG